MTQHPHLFSPARIGSMEVRNRLVMAPMGVEIVGDDGTANEAITAYYEERARGGVGLIVTEVCAVSYPRGANSVHQLGLSDDRFVGPLAELTRRVHHHGAKIAAQLVHHGKVSRVDAKEGRPVLAASAPEWHGSLDMVHDLTPDEIGLMMASSGDGVGQPRAATVDEIAELVDDFAAAAERARRAGFDGVEIHAAHGYLISGFLSRQWNRRDDEYGGPLENRARLMCEVIAACRERTGGDFPVWVRLDALEYRTPDGITFDDAQRTAELAVAAGADAIHLSAYGDMTSGGAFTEGTLPHVAARHAALAGQLKTRVDVPVVAVGRLDADVAEEMVANGKADLVAMGRQMLADPATAAKLAAGEADDIRPCIYCYTCVAQPFFDRRVRCAVNPAVAHELDLADADRTLADDARRVVVVGGGPAGMEAARVAARRGHRVTLFEAADQLGGSLRFAAVVYEPNERLLDWLTRQLADAGVDVRTGTPAAGAAVRALDPHVVIVATGAAKTRPDIPGIDRREVLDGDDLRALLTGSGSDDALSKLSPFGRVAVRAGRALGLTRDAGRLAELSKHYMPIGKRVVVLGGGLVGVELAEFLVERGRHVTVLEEGDSLAREMAHPRRWRVLEDLRGHGADLRTGVTFEAVEDGGVRITAGDGSELVPADSVVVATPLAADESVAEMLRAEGHDPVVIGDCSGVGYIEGAMSDGFRAGLAVG